jgi:hypothetical protein
MDAAIARRTICTFSSDTPYPRSLASGSEAAIARRVSSIGFEVVTAPGIERGVSRRRLSLRAISLAESGLCGPTVLAAWPS